MIAISIMKKIIRQSRKSKRHFDRSSPVIRQIQNGLGPKEIWSKHQGIPRMKILQPKSCVSTFNFFLDWFKRSHSSRQSAWFLLTGKINQVVGRIPSEKISKKIQWKSKSDTFTRQITVLQPDSDFIRSPAPDSADIRSRALPIAMPYFGELCIYALLRIALYSPMFYSECPTPNNRIS